MALIGIKAVFECDECGVKMTVNVDAAEDGPPIEVAEAELNDGGVLELTGFSGVRVGQHLCPSCTKNYDTANELAFDAEDAKRY